MAEIERIDRLEQQLTAALAEIDRLRSIEAIRTCLYAVSRGIDRIDENLLRGAFHPRAQIHYGRLYDGEVEGWIPSALTHQRGQSQRQHLIGNIYIKLSDDEAVAESYEIDRHLTPMNGEVRDLVLAARTVDRLARREGEWRIVERTKIMDWGRALAADGAIYANSPLPTGRDDRSDPSYPVIDAL
jgi:hypothetical protein